MKIVIRTDSGKHIGLGHVTRCLTLARALKKRGHHITFVSRCHIGNIISRISDEFPCIVFDDGLRDLSQYSDTDYSTWLGVTQDQEINDYNDFLSTHGTVDLTIIDHYGIDVNFERKILGKVLVIDDLVCRKHDCDFLVNQNLSVDPQAYLLLNSRKNCKYFVGTKYAILRSEFSDYRPCKPSQVDEVRNVLVFFGGSDITHETKKVIDAYLEITQDIHLKVIIDDQHNDYDYIYKKVSGISTVDLSSYDSNIAKSLTETDVSFGAAGATSWERCCLGVPSFVITAADNQIDIAKSLAEAGGSYYVGDGRKTDIGDWKTVFENLCDIKKINALAYKSYHLCDGHGVERLVKKLEL